MKLLVLTFLLFIFSSSSSVRESSLKSDIARRLFELFDRHTSGLSDSQIASVRDKRPELSAPFVLAVYFKQPDKEAEWRWTKDDRDGVLNTIAAKKSVKKNAFELINNSGKEEELDGLCLMAAQQGADALLVIQGVGEVETDANALCEWK